jgi:predicted AAA+ superfamily ATPase
MIETKNEISDTLKVMNPWWDNKYKTTFIPREKYLEPLQKSLNKKLITIITGIRRVGKTTTIKTFIERLINKQHISQKKIFYVTLDHYLFKKINLFEIIKEFRKINNLKRTEKIYLFLDEITYQDEFQQQIKNIFDIENVKLYVSSSSSNVLKDKKAFTTGRTNLIEMMPLDFKEFLIFNKIDYKSTDSYLLEKYYEKHLKLGGIPQYVLTKDPEVITGLVSDIIEKDIKQAYKLKGNVIDDLFLLLCNRVGKRISYNKLSRVLNSNHNTIKEYIEYFKKTYLFYTIGKYSKSSNETATSSKKVYVGDIAIRNISIGIKQKGILHENLVFLEIVKKKPSYYLKNNIELDFAYKNNLIEAKYNNYLNEKQEKLFKELKFKNKSIADGYNFFIDDIKLK